MPGENGKAGRDGQDDENRPERKKAAQADTDGRQSSDQPSELGRTDGGPNGHGVGFVEFGGSGTVVRLAHGRTCRAGLIVRGVP